MHDGLSDDLFNPKFVYFSPVHLDELTAAGLPRERFAAHVDNALAAWQLGTNKAEQSLSVRDIALELLGPVTAPTTMRIDVWVEHLDRQTCIYGFLCSSENGNIPFARGERTLTRVVPSAWSDDFRARHATLLKELPAYA
jgi:acyl-CoA thioester hydrolase